MDRSVRLYDIRRPDPVVRTFKGHKSHVVALRPHWENENRFTTWEIAGKALVWDLRATIPYHQIDVYDYSMDRRSDQARVLDMEWTEDGYFIGGSARKVFWFTQ